MTSLGSHARAIQALLLGTALALVVPGVAADENAPAADIVESGTLVIVGGGLGADNEAIHRAFIDSLPAEGAVVIIPAASSQPVQSGQSFTDNLERHGLDPARVLVYPLAMRDDEVTVEVDESTWSQAAWNVDRVESLGLPAAFWFTGGDQSRITATLRNGDMESPLLSLIHQRLAAGATVGGTSAGAAIMSRHMIAGGESFTALAGPRPDVAAGSDGADEDPLLLATGLGFLPGAIVDQHFGQRARLGRLVVALAASEVSIGYGIDEDTALVVDLGGRSARVLGSGGVTLLDARAASFDLDGEAPAQNLRLGYAAHGARFPLHECILTGAVGQSTLGSEYYNRPAAAGGGMAFADPGLGRLLGSELLDNAGASKLLRLSVHQDGRLLEYRFTQLQDSTGWWSDENGPSRYSLCDVRFDVHRKQWALRSAP